MLKFRADFIYLLNKTPTNKQTTHTKGKTKKTQPKHLELSVKSVPLTNSAVLAINTAL